MSSYSIRREHGFLDTGRLVRTHAAPRPVPLTELLMEAGEMLRGALEAPLRRAGQTADYRDVAALPEHLKKDIGLEV